MGNLVALANTAASQVTTLLDEGMTTALTNGFNVIGSDYTAIVKLALPAALTIFALAFAIRKGVGFFCSIAG